MMSVMETENFISITDTATVGKILKTILPIITQLDCQIIDVETDIIDVDSPKSFVRRVREIDENDHYKYKVKLLCLKRGATWQATLK